MIKRINALTNSLFIALIFLAINSCKKDGTSNHKETLEIKNWYEELTRKNPFSELQPEWESISIVKFENQNVYELRFRNPDALAVLDGGKGNPDNKINADIRLLVFKDLSTDKITDGCYMLILPEAKRQVTAMHYKEMKDFNGKVIFYTMEGKLANGWQYAGGRLTQRIAPDLQSLNASAKLASKLAESTGKGQTMIYIPPPCVTSVPVWSESCITVGNYTSCTYYISEYICFDGPVPPDGGGGGYEPPASNGGYGGTGAGTVSNQINNFTMDKEIQKQYPKFTELIKSLEGFVKNDQKVMDALKKWSGLSEQKILEKIKFGQGPEIALKDLDGKFGYFNESEDPNVINIDASWARGLEIANLIETKQATAFLLAVTVLHELVHLTRAENGLDRKYEYGFGFEQSAFGIIVEDNGIAPYKLMYRLFKK